MHGEDDQIVPIDISGRKSAKLIKGKKTAWYEPQYRAKAEEILKEILEAVGLPIVR